ncbi:MAG: aspartyl-phosphate phosphatase Spo0E family protein [Sporomusaceae bacterium]|nr:aspartyl-phosphate phosphatase Spo0E family protein [Sporomusaceae bacterium]
MLTRNEQEEKIEEMRSRLNGLVAAKGFNLNDQDIIRLSRELDLLLVDFERNKRKAI